MMGNVAVTICSGPGPAVMLQSECQQNVRACLKKENNMIRITQLKLSINHTPEELSQKIRKELRLKNEGFTYEIVKQSLDCRHKEDKKFVYTVDVSAG